MSERLISFFERMQVRLRRPLRHWLQNNPRARKVLRQFRCFDTDTDAISRGAAIGLFFGLTPTVGFQTLLLLPSCSAVRGNFPLAFAATWVNNPVTIGPLYLAFNWLGEQFVRPNLLSASTTDAYPWLGTITDETIQMIVGSLFIATPTAILGFFIIRTLIKSRALAKA